MKTKKPCAECPFRSTAPAGWLGPWSVDEIAACAHSEGGLACHMDVNKKGEGLPIEEYAQCVGAILHANKTFKRYQNPRLAEMQRLTKAEDLAGILGFEFKTYHSKVRK